MMHGWFTARNDDAIQFALTCMQKIHHSFMIQKVRLQRYNLFRQNKFTIMAIPAAKVASCGKQDASNRIGKIDGGKWLYTTNQHNVD